jgi:hypothetical protein
MLAFRTQDQVDIENLLAANRGQLDLNLIRREWQTVGSLDDPRLQRFNDMAARLYLRLSSQSAADAADETGTGEAPAGPR